MRQVAHVGAVVGAGALVLTIGKRLLCFMRTMHRTFARASRMLTKKTMDETAHKRERGGGGKRALPEDRQVWIAILLE